MGPPDENDPRGQKIYRGFGGKLYHEVPGWVDPGALFHVRIRARGTVLTAPELAPLLMQSAMLYQERHRWHITLRLLMPDHLHALLAFPINESMSAVIGDWKRFQARRHGIVWQEGYFDHRLRDRERGDHLQATAVYIHENPVVKGLCARAEDWPWVYPRLDQAAR